jgi:protein-tyrosine phosphatase
MITLLLPENGATVCLQTAAQIAFAENSRDYATSDFDWRNLTQTSDPDCSFPAPVVFSWETDGMARLQISRTEEFASIVREVMAENSATVYNLEIGRTYYWRVICDDDQSEIRTFTTEDRAPRWLYIDGTTNVRDIGGLKTMDGRRIRQGLLFRGSEMDTHKEITQAGIAELRVHLGVKTDLDIRGEVVGKRFDSPLGEDVRFCLVPVRAYDEYFRDIAPYPTIFDLLANEESYPIYFHCWGGADRTGSLACMIEALCGVSDEDQDLDYELTSLSVWDKRSRTGKGWQMFINELAAFGETRQEQTRAFLRRVGVSDETMDRVVQILVED